MISIIATALKTNCAVETRPGSGSAFKQSLLTRSIEAEDIEYMIIAETDALVSLASSGIFFESLRRNTGAACAGAGAYAGAACSRATGWQDASLAMH